MLTDAVLEGVGHGFVSDLLGDMTLAMPGEVAWHLAIAAGRPRANI
jgi:hypothetical protein